MNHKEKKEENEHIIYIRTQIRFTSILLLCITKWDIYRNIYINETYIEKKWESKMLNETELHFTHEANRTTLLNKKILKICSVASLVTWWLKIHLPMQGTCIWSLVWEDPTCHRATRSMRYSYWLHTPRSLKSMSLEPVLCNKRNHHNERPGHCNKE